MSENQGYEAPEDWAQYTNMSVGDILRRTREYYGLTLEQVEGVLRIRACQLEALEINDLERLPGRVYAIGFVRTYSEYLGLDGNKMVHLFKTQSVGNNRPELSFPVAASESKLPNRYILVSCTVALCALVVSWVAFNGNEPKMSKEIPPVPEELKIELASLHTKMPLEAAVLAAIEPASGDVPGDLKEHIVVNITESTWVEIRDSDGRALVSQVLNPGDSYTVPVDQGLILDTGNAGGIEITINGSKIPPLGERGDILRGIILDPKELTNYKADTKSKDAKE
jgi:cytoskeletal protein RodZ